MNISHNFMISWKNNSFVNNLRSSIDNTCIFSPTGKYGRNVIDHCDTRKEKLEKLLSAEPQNIDDLTAYVFYVDSLDGLKYEKIYKKIQSLLEQAKLMGVPRRELSTARKVFGRVKRKKNLMRTLRVVIWLIAIIGVVVLNIISLWYLFLVLPIFALAAFVASDIPDVVKDYGDPF